jgi:UDP-glucose 4-epimerase
VLLSREEMAAAQDLGNYYRIPPDLRDLNYGKFVDQGEIRISEAVEYSSHNTHRLDVKGMQDLLMRLRFMNATINGEQVEAEE